MSKEIIPETKELIEEVYNINLSNKQVNLKSTEYCNTIYERLMSEIIKRDDKIRERDEELVEAIDLISKLREELDNGARASRA